MMNRIVLIYLKLIVYLRHILLQSHRHQWKFLHTHIRVCTMSSDLAILRARFAKCKKCSSDFCELFQPQHFARWNGHMDSNGNSNGWAKNEDIWTDLHIGMPPLEVTYTHTHTPMYGMHVHGRGGGEDGDGDKPCVRCITDIAKRNYMAGEENRQQGMMWRIADHVSIKIQQ